MPSSFDPYLSNMRRVQRTMQDTLYGVVSEASRDCTSLEGAVLFVQDPYHEGEAGAIVTANVSGVDPETFDFQREHIQGRRVDLSASTLGSTFESGQFKLEPSTMNPEKHSVAGLLLDRSIGARATVVQFAFTNGKETPTARQLEVLRGHLSNSELAFAQRVHELDQYSKGFPKESLTDALQLDLPTPPNAFVISWDTTNSRLLARSDYVKLRTELALRGRSFLEIVEQGGGRLLQGTGDGQSFALDLPASPVRLSRESISTFAANRLVPIIEALSSAALKESETSVRFTVDLGRIEETKLGTNGPVLFSNATVSKRQKKLVAFGEGMHGILGNPADRTS